MNTLILEKTNNQDLKLNDPLVFSKEGKNCIVTISEIQNKLIKASSGKCEFKDKIVVGDKASKPLMNINSTANKLSELKKNNDDIEYEKKWNFILGIGYMIASSDGRFDDANYSTSGLSIASSAKLSYSKVASLDIGIRNVEKNSWGFLGGLNYAFDRKFEDGSIGSIKVTSTSGSSKIQFTTLYANAVYKWNRLFVPFGLNYSIVKYTPASGFSGTFSESGGIGAQAGVGWEFDKSISLELYSWITAVKLTASSGNEKLELGTGYFPSLNAFVKYGF